MNKVIAGIEGQDWISGEQLAPGKWRLHARGCHLFLETLRELVASNSNPETWSEPTGRTHADLLLKEFIQKVRGTWDFPYKHEEICHCRAVLTQVVDQAILNGAFTTARVSRETSASTSCATCRPDVESIIKMRLGA